MYTTRVIFGMMDLGRRVWWRDQACLKSDLLIFFLERKRVRVKIVILWESLTVGLFLSEFDVCDRLIEGMGFELEELVSNYT